MPVSYDTSQTLKCTVTFNYIRYWNEKSAFQKSNTPQTTEDAPGPIPAIENLRNNTDGNGNYVNPTKSNTTQQIENYTRKTNTSYQSEAEKKGTGIWQY